MADTLSANISSLINEMGLQEPENPQLDTRNNRGFGDVIGRGAG